MCAVLPSISPVSTSCLTLWPSRENRQAALVRGPPPRVHPTLSPWPPAHSTQARQDCRNQLGYPLPESLESQLCAGFLFLTNNTYAGEAFRKDRERPAWRVGCSSAASTFLSASESLRCRHLGRLPRDPGARGEENQQGWPWPWPCHTPTTYLALAVGCPDPCGQTRRLQPSVVKTPWSPAGTTEAETTVLSGRFPAGLLVPYAPSEHAACVPSAPAGCTDPGHSC